MIKVNIDINQLKNELATIHGELLETVHGTDNQRRDSVNRIIEKIRTLKGQLSEIEVKLN
jgi:hypothetical protein